MSEAEHSANQLLQRWVGSGYAQGFSEVFERPHTEICEAFAALRILRAHEFDQVTSRARTIVWRLEDRDQAALALQLDALTEAGAQEAFERHFLTLTQQELSRSLGSAQAANRQAFDAFLRSAEVESWPSERMVLAFVFAGDSKQEYGHKVLETGRSDEELDRVRAALAREKSPALTLDRPLRIAWCISGQLRGYQAAAASWRHIGLEAHEVSTFVHVWSKVGCKHPEPGQLERCFSGELLQALETALLELGWAELSRRYRHLFNWFGNADQVDEAYLKDFYGAEKVIVEDDASAEFDHWSNYRKMYYKISGAHHLAEGKFDLVVRIRPDKSLSGVFPWRDLAERASQGGLVFVDFPYNHHPSVGFVVGDQFAASSQASMDVYASVYRKTIKRDLSQVQPVDFEPHANLAYNLALGGFEVERPAGIGFGDLLGPPPIAASVALSLLEEDIGAPDRIDLAVMAAARRDAEREQAQHVGEIQL